MSDMNEQARRQLGELIRQYGSSVCSDMEHCEQLLQTPLAAHPRELNGLVQALRAGVPAKLLEGVSLPTETLLQQLTRELSRDRSLAEAVARWSVEAWAVALGVMTEEECAAVPVLQKTPT